MTDNTPSRASDDCVSGRSSDGATPPYPPSELLLNRQRVKIRRWSLNLTLAPRRVQRPRPQNQPLTTEATSD